MLRAHLLNEIQSNKVREDCNAFINSFQISERVDVPGSVYSYISKPDFEPFNV